MHFISLELRKVIDKTEQNSFRYRLPCIAPLAPSRSSRMAC